MTENELSKKNLGIVSDGRTQNRLSCYVLTVDKPGGLRRSNAAKELERFPFDWRFVDGYDARDAVPREVYSSWRNALAMKRSMTAGEIACYAGHRKIWELILASGEDAALVLEDDFQVVDAVGFSSGIAAALRRPECWDLIKYFDFQPKRVVGEASWDGVRFVQFKYPASGMVAYLISRRGCEAMLRRKKIYRPVDEDLSYPWETSIRVWSMDPNPVTEIARRLGGSLLEEDRLRRQRKEPRPLRRLYGKWLSLSKKIHSVRHCYFNRQDAPPPHLEADAPVILPLRSSEAASQSGLGAAREKAA